MEKTIHKINFAKDDPVTITSHEVYFSLYQQLAGNDEETDNGEDPVARFASLFQKDFFDLIIVDECHRGSAKKDSNWRKILEYFSSAAQIGMTATPNPKVGKDFQNKVKQWFETDRNTPLYLEHAINIGTPSRPHKFDISDMDEDLVIECKCYTWTDSGNIPSAKLRGLNEAIFYFSFLPPQTEKNPSNGTCCSPPKK